MQLQAAVNQLPADSEANPRFNNLLQLMNRVLEQGRLAVQGLRSANGDLPSLGQALADVPTELGLSSAVGFRVVVEGRQRELRAGLHDEVYRIGREAIVNAYRHSRATDIETEIEHRPGEMRIVVRDNGCGIDPQVLQRNGHWGLQGMRERADKIGSRLKLWSRVAGGTEVELSVPGHVAFRSHSPNRRPHWLTGLRPRRGQPDNQGLRHVLRKPSFPPKNFGYHKRSISCPTLQW